jgi:hypothetical protein
MSERLSYGRPALHLRGPFSLRLGCRLRQAKERLSLLEILATAQANGELCWHLSQMSQTHFVEERCSAPSVGRGPV